MNIRITTCNTEQERFCLTCHGDLAELEVSSPLVGQFAKSQLIHGLKSDCLGEFVGECTSQFAIRALWLEHVPDTVDEIIELGYNTVIIKEGASSLRHKGLKVVSKEPEFADYLFCEQDEHGCPKDLTPFERACVQIQELEKRFNMPIFYHTKPNCPFLLQLCRHISKKSIIAFNGFCHPVLRDIARLPIIDRTPLMPIITIDGAGGLSDIPLLEIEDVLGRQRQNRFLGAGCRVSHGDPSNLASWLIGQRLWRSSSLIGLFDVWLKRYHPDWQGWLTVDLINKIHAIFDAIDDNERAIPALIQLAEELSSYKTALRFKKVPQDLSHLSTLLYEFQVALKARFEASLTGSMRKIPLALQNFVPTNFVCKKLVYSI